MIAAIFVLTTGVLPDDTFAQSNKKGSSSAIASKSSKGKRGKAKSTRQNKAKSSQGGGKSRGQSGRKGNSNASDSTRGSLGSSNGSGNVALTSQVPATNTTQYAATPIPSTVETTTAIDAERNFTDRVVEYYGNLVPRTGRPGHEDRPECLVKYDLCLIDEIKDSKRRNETDVKYREPATELLSKISEYHGLMLEKGYRMEHLADPPEPEDYESLDGIKGYLEIQTNTLERIREIEEETEILREEIADLEQKLAEIVNDLQMAFSKKECLEVYRLCEYEMDQAPPEGDEDSDPAPPGGEEGSEQDAIPLKIVA